VLRPGGTGRPVYGEGISPPGIEPEGGGRTRGKKPGLFQPPAVPSKKGHLPGAAPDHPDPPRLPPARLQFPVDPGNREQVRISQCQSLQPGLQRDDGHHPQGVPEPKKQKGGQKRERQAVKSLPTQIPSQKNLSFFKKGTSISVSPHFVYSKEKGNCERRKVRP